MTISPAGVATARQNVAQRIERLLKIIERAHRPPSRREIFHVGDALELMKVGRYPEAQEAMLKAERALPVPPDAAHRLDTNPTTTVERLRAQLAEALTGAG
ncbi:hypothetical protein BH10PSE6_BH10PSE6_04630 [soil metagenome]